MPFGPAFKLSTYLLVATGIAALFQSAVLSPLATAGVALAFAATWWADRVRPHLTSRAVTWIGAALIAFLVVDLALLAESFFDSIIHLLVLLLLYKLVTWQTARDAIHLGILSFFMLVAASAVTLSVGFLGIFLAFLILGTGTFALLHLQQEAEESSGDARRALEAAGIVTPGFVLICLGFSLAALALTTAIFFALPRLGRAFLPLQTRTGVLATGFTDHIQLGAAGSIQTDPTVVMRVYLPDHPEGWPPPGGLRWRGLAFDHFDGTIWSASKLAQRMLARRPDGAFVFPRRQTGRGLLRQDVDMEPLGTDVLFAAPVVLAIEGPMTSLRTDGAGAALLPQRVLTRLRYTAYSRVLAAPPGAAEDILPAALARAYLQVPPTSPQVGELARELAGDARSPLEVARRLEAGLRQRYRYSLSLGRDPRLDPVTDFLFRQRAGHCEYFAASLAVMLRLVGVPSRLVNGFQAGEWNEYGRYFTVRQRDAHAWVEAFIPGAGWATFDPSPRAEFEAALGQGPGQMTRFLDFLKTRWTRYVVDYTLGDQIQVTQAIRQRTAWARAEVAATFGEWTRQIGLPAWAWRWVAAGALAVAAAGLLRLRRGGGLRQGGRWAGGDVRFFLQLQRALARRGLSAVPGETPLELARRAAAAERNLAPAEEITRLYYRVRFGAKPLAPDEAAHVATLLAGLENPQASS
jgi:transglutaminase-like putative cysteine protease